MQGKLIEFIRQKDYKFIEEIGQGGTGRTVLLEDEIINERFVCKKYSPFFSEHKQIFFGNFKDEIKLLYLLNHKNVVRVFNYYLYPEHYTGYILMEYIQGQNINDYLTENPDKLNEIFRQVISGFAHLEQAGILHRDIRPDNILISNEGVVKIIDFGFSKKVNFDSDFTRSIDLNWRYSLPIDFAEQRYDFKTEVYFVGKLFEEIIHINQLSSFNYLNVLNRMIETDYSYRIETFFAIEREIIDATVLQEPINYYEKDIYQTFASGLESSIFHIDIAASYITEVSEIIRNLEILYKNSMLEDFIQNNGNLLKCFIKGGFAYKTTEILEVDTIFKFHKFLSESSKEKQKLIVNHIWQRLDKAKRFDDDIPF
ncbi:protein kinase family protein [Psychrobacter frigidicola]|uniref:protein kinase family protein n=1 Tax=Psychrobacter frigidicola TaxID=45611 RepID=UPI0019197439|nr:protein kinase family protein [Psychrobacter frigidicola]